MKLGIRNNNNAEGLLQPPGGGLRQRAIWSGVWAFALRITERGFSLIRLIILARVLAPNDFGLLGIALLAMMTLETFSQTGLQAALIQRKGKTEDYLSIAWTVSILRGLVLFIILFFTAPYVAIFFDAPAATPIIRVIGITALLQGFTNIGVIYFQKDLEFNKQFFYRLSGTLADFAVAVSAALILKSVWALVFGLLAGAIVRLIVSYLLHPYRPRLSSDLGKAKELFGFGKWILGSTIIIFLLVQGDDILVGKLLGATLLGFYQMAYRFSSAPATEITHVISQVTFPVYSKLQDKLPSLRAAYLETLQLTALVSMPLAGGMFILAPEFTTIFLGDKWIPMVPAMQVLCVYGALRSINATFGPLYHAVGHPAILTKISFIQLCFFVAVIYPLTTKWEILGASIAVMAASILCFFLASHQALRILNESRKTLFRILASPTLLTSSIVASVYLIKVIATDRIPLLVIFILSIFVALGIYSAYAKISGLSLKNLWRSGKLSGADLKEVD